MGALTEMAKPSGKAADILASHGCTGCTDVTGFGLLGHLVEMTKPSQVHAELFMQSVPLLNGAQETLGAGVTSSLHAQNARAAASVRNFDQVLQTHPQLWPILVDPQTGGGLLAGVAWEKAEACVQELRENGYGSTAIIGKVTKQDHAVGPIQIL
ncbi:AIR synthase-related protein [Dunaliella salina]|uniref:AIR synthase-related protein n=1 Tax=Dunaliella salina TaxID=3046 RepID=A0ABQ7GXC0_DUNSA|nr:AIR synthase-related protein [Dunaliella salina]|eukprot:KAF5839250.1 AIR synthase-related protein [Dunaliella salina]